jgi:hypothetical protein
MVRSALAVASMPARLRWGLEASACSAFSAGDHASAMMDPGQGGKQTGNRYIIPIHVIPIGVYCVPDFPRFIMQVKEDDVEEGQRKGQVSVCVCVWGGKGGGAHALVA